MFIILPNKIEGMADLEAALTEDTFQTMDRAMRSSKIEVGLPKFKVEADVKIKAVLTEMGISDLFDENTADLSGISGRNELYVSDAFHKAFVEVNEEGSEAAAATGLSLTYKRYIELHYLGIRSICWKKHLFVALEMGESVFLPCATQKPNSKILNEF